MERTLIIAATPPSSICRILDGFVLDGLELCWVVVAGCCVIAVTIGPAIVGVIGCCGEFSVMGLPAVFHGVDAQGSSTVMVLEDTYMGPSQVVTGMRHCASSRLALVRSVVRGGCSWVNKTDGDEDFVEFEIGDRASHAW